MCKFLGTYNLTSTRHKKETLNRQIKSKMTESLMKSHPTKRNPGTDGFTAGFYQQRKPSTKLNRNLWNRRKYLQTIYLIMDMYC